MIIFDFFFHFILTWWTRRAKYEKKNNNNWNQFPTSYTVWRCTRIFQFSIVCHLYVFILCVFTVKTQNLFISNIFSTLEFVFIIFQINIIKHRETNRQTSAVECVTKIPLTLYQFIGDKIQTLEQNLFIFFLFHFYFPPKKKNPKHQNQLFFIMQPIRTLLSFTINAFILPPLFMRPWNNNEMITNTKKNLFISRGRKSLQ